MEIVGRIEAEEKFAARLSKLNARHRKRLQKALGNPPDVANIPPGFWASIQAEQGEELLSVLLLLYLASSKQAEAAIPERIPGERHSLQQLQTEARDWAQRRAGVLAQGHVQVARERLSTVQQTWNQIIDDGKRITRQTVLDDLEPTFGPGRAASQAVTETTAARQEAVERVTLRRGQISESDKWVTERDARVCPICAPLHNRNRTIWARRFPTGPPAHPNCRCIIEYAWETQPALPFRPGE